MKTTNLAINFFQKDESSDLQDPVLFKLTLLENNCCALSHLRDYKNLHSILSDWLKIYDNPETQENAEVSYIESLKSTKNELDTKPNHNYDFTDIIPNENFESLVINSMNNESFFPSNNKDINMSFELMGSEIMASEVTIQNIGKFEKIVYDDGRVYEGYVVNDEPHGYGCVYCKDGTRYIGEWKNGQKHGKGFDCYRPQEYYYGDWVYGRQEGVGEYK